MFISPLLKWLRFHLSIQWPPVWARRPKPTRPAGAERPPLSPSSPHAAQPLGSWSPDFSLRVVTQERGGAGSKQNGLPRQLAGVPPATRALKVSISLAGDRSPQRHRGCREAGSGPPPAGWFSQGFFFLPHLSFSRTKKKDGVRGGSQPRIARGVHPPHTNAPPDKTIINKKFIDNLTVSSDQSAVYFINPRVVRSRHYPYSANLRPLIFLVLAIYL